MSRALTPEMAAAAAAPTVSPRLLLEYQGVTTMVRYWTGLGTLSWDGHDWLGIGHFISVGPIEETDDVKAGGTTVKIAGASLVAITDALLELRSGKPGAVRLALMDTDGAVIADPKILFRGKLDQVEIDDSDPANPLLLLAFENRLIDLMRPREWRFTDAHQKKLYPGDTGFRFVEAMQDRTLTWGWVV